MKYTCKVDINAPLDKVVSLFSEPDNLRYWQPGLISYEHLGGEKRKAGATARLLHKMGKREIVMMETILKNDLPHAMKSSYEANGVMNIQESFFEPVDERSTRFTSVNEFKLTGFMKLMGWFMPGAFRKQTMKYMEQFKSFAESKKPVTHGIENTTP